MDYFMQKLGEANNDIKETWKILNPALGKRSKPQQFISNGGL